MKRIICGIYIEVGIIKFILFLANANFCKKSVEKLFVSFITVLYVFRINNFWTSSSIKKVTTCR